MTVKGHICEIHRLKGHISFGGGSGRLPWYEGAYEVTPKAYTEQILETAQKSMHENVTVHKVPRYDVDNPFGGKTVSIAVEV